MKETQNLIMTTGNPKCYYLIKLNQFKFVGVESEL